MHPSGLENFQAAVKGRETQRQQYFTIIKGQIHPEAI